MVRVLLAAGAHVDLKGSGNATALMVAASQGSNAVIPVLVQAGADVSSFQGLMGRNPLLSAIANQNYRGACLLALNGADLNNQGGELATMAPLMLASAHGSLVAVQCLTSAGARLNDRSQSSGLTALDYAIQGHHDAVAAFLSERGAEPSTSPPR